MTLFVSGGRQKPFIQSSFKSGFCYYGLWCWLPFFPGATSGLISSEIQTVDFAVVTISNKQSPPCHDSSALSLFESPLAIECISNTVNDTTLAHTLFGLVLLICHRL